MMKDIVKRFFFMLAGLGLTLALQGCPVGTSGIGSIPGASPIAATGPSDVRKDDASQVTDPADVSPSAPPPSEEIAMRKLPAGDAPSDTATRGLDTPLPAPSFDLDEHGLSALMGDFYFFSETGRTYTPLPQNRMRTEVEGYVYVAHLDQASPCCQGRAVFVKDDLNGVCRIVHIGINGYLKVSLTAAERKVPLFSYHFAEDGSDPADGVVDCDAAFEPFSHHKLFVFNSWNVCKATLPEEGTPIVFADDQPWKADYCMRTLARSVQNPDFKIDSSLRLRAVQQFFKLPETQPAAP